MMPRSTVYLRKCGYDGAAPVVNELMAASGIAFGGKKVLVKPNILSAEPPERAVTTHPAIVGAVVDFLLDAGASVTVGDNPGIGGYGAAAEAAGKSGIIGASRGRYENIVLKSRGVPVKSKYLDTLQVSEAVLDAEIIVNLPKLKTHGLTTYTGAVKNMFGMLVGAEKSRVHGLGRSAESFAEALVDVFSVRPPDLSIMDGITGMDGDGPHAGRPREVGILGMSRDAAALDAVMIRLIGLEPAKIHHVRIASEQGFGAMNAQDIAIDGEPPPAVKFRVPKSRMIEMFGDAGLRVAHGLIFGSLADYARLKLDRKKCTKCSVCITGCPTEAMRTGGDEFPFIDKEKCIACYCCHELCPESAWKMAGMMRLMTG
jgi:uncharacterized protein (DUF362 family)/ferredoxin